MKFEERYGRLKDLKKQERIKNSKDLSEYLNRNENDDQRQYQNELNKMAKDDFLEKIRQEHRKPTEKSIHNCVKSCAFKNRFEKEGNDGRDD